MECPKCDSEKVVPIDENTTAFGPDWVVYECDDCGHSWRVMEANAPDPLKVYL